MNADNNILTDLTDSVVRRKFEELYIALRAKESRIYTDDQIVQLPFINSSHVHSAEWGIRRRSAFRLLAHLGKMGRRLAILETGCGNGWLSGRLGSLPGSTVMGIDINESELNQAKRVFGTRDNIHFRVGDIHHVSPDKKFDIVLFAASIQYFSSFDQTITKALSLLQPDGEIHIVDSPFYSESEIVHAAERSDMYYRSIGFGEMTNFYFYHTYETLKKYNHKILFNPFRLENKLFRRKDPFPWICIKAS